MLLKNIDRKFPNYRKERRKANTQAEKWINNQPKK
tara:strand:+ start:467 stop:571 length:105 start_codon:yes stop_codon:yes gene_type:complete